MFKGYQLKFVTKVLEELTTKNVYDPIKLLKKTNRSWGKKLKRVTAAIIEKNGQVLKSSGQKGTACANG